MGAMNGGDVDIDAVAVAKRRLLRRQLDARWRSLATAVPAAPTSRLDGHAYRRPRGPGQHLRDDTLNEARLLAPQQSGSQVGWG